MTSVRVQIQDIRKRIHDLKESRKAVSEANQRLQTQINENRAKRSNQSAEIKQLFVQIRDIRKTVRENIASEKTANSHKKNAEKKVLQPK